MKIQKKEIFFIVGFIICLFLAFVKHYDTGTNNYRSQLWGDPSGYYVYLPATFIYGYHASDFPEGIVKNVGFGFTLNQETNKMRTKYTSGIAILIVPFFLIVHLIAIFFSLDPSGFSPVYYKMIDVAAVFYLTLGLYFLWKFLCYYFSKKISTLTIFILFLSTNLYYYSISATLFTHVYSFFLFSLFLYVLKRHIIEKPPKSKHIFLISIISALIVLIRPTNIVFIVAAFFLDINSVLDFKLRIRHFLHPVSILMVILAGIIIFLPQSLYWHFLTNKFIDYTYKGEGFTNWNAPKIIEVLISTTNGLIVWTPIFVFIIFSMFLTVFKREKNSIPALITFCLTLYLCASWHMWYFGCGFSQRSFVEYLALFSVPVAYGLEYLNHIKNSIFRIVIYLLIVFCIYFNLKMTYTYNVCFFGGTWDWKEYSNYFDKNRMFGFTSSQYCFFNNFDGKIWNPKATWLQTVIKSKNSYSGDAVSKIDKINKISSGFESVLLNIGHRPVQSAEVSFQSFVYNSPDKFYIVCEIDSSEISVLNQKKNLRSLCGKIRQWNKINHKFNIPLSMNQYHTIKLYVLNLGKDSLLIDDLKIVFRY